MNKKGLLFGHIDISKIQYLKKDYLRSEKNLGSNYPYNFTFLTFDHINN